VAEASDIAAVRENTAEPDETNFTDVEISALIDLYGIDVASATIWTRKAAEYADLVDVSEAGSTHKFSDLHKNALEMAGVFTAAEASKTKPGGRTIVRKIVRQ
jgi:hypothetical protein